MGEDVSSVECRVIGNGNVQNERRLNKYKPPPRDMFNDRRLRQKVVKGTQGLRGLVKGATGVENRAHSKYSLGPWFPDFAMHVMWCTRRPGKAWIGEDGNRVTQTQGEEMRAAE